MIKKKGSSKKKKIQEELKAIKQFRSIAVILNNDDIENAFLSNVAGQSETVDESVTSDSLSKVSGQEFGFKKLAEEEGRIPKHSKNRMQSKGNNQLEKRNSKAMKITDKRIKRQKKTKR